MSDYENFEDLATQAMERDPQQAPVGYLTGGSFVLDSTRVFCWFDSVKAAIEHLREVEPRVHQLEPGEELDRYHGLVDPVIEKIRTDGLTEDARRALNIATSDSFVVDWWGTFESLTGGDSQFAKEARINFRGDDEDGSPIKDEELEDFIEFLTQYRI